MWAGGAGQAREQAVVWRIGPASEGVMSGPEGEGLGWLGLGVSWVWAVRSRPSGVSRPGLGRRDRQAGLGKV